MDLNSPKAAQIMAIKKRLNSAVTKSSYSLYQLANEINNSADSPLTVSYNTLKNNLDYSNTALDTIVVIALCRFLHLDSAYILAPPDAPESDLQSTFDLSTSPKFIMLDDEKYLGTFHGYSHDPNPSRHGMIHFELNLDRRGDRSHAKFQYTLELSSVDNEILPSERILFGTPYFCVNHSNIFILLTNDYGDFYFLYFGRQKFRVHGLYFRRGALLTACALGTRPAMAQNFVLFAHPISEEKLKYVAGMIDNVSPTFTIPVATADELRKQEPVVDSFLSEFSYILDHDRKDMYVVNETQILASIGNRLNQDNTIKAMLLLKDASFSTTGQFIYEDVDAFASFSKNFLQQGN